MIDRSDEPEYRSIADWCADLGLDPDEVVALLAANPGLDPNDALTAGELADLFRPGNPPANPKDACT